MSLNRAKELRQERTPLIEQAGALLTKAHDDGKRDLTPEERTQFELLHSKADDNGVSHDEQLSNEQRQMRAFGDWMKYGPQGVRAEDQAVSQRMRVSSSNPDVRAAQTVTTTGGGHLIPDGFQMELDKAMLAYGSMRQACRVVTTATGNTMDWPTIDDTGNTGALLDVNAAVTSLALAYGQQTFDAYKYTSRSVLVPVELMQDSAFDMNSHVTEMLAERLGRITNTQFTTGTGTNQPNGIVTAAADSGINLSLANTNDDWVLAKLLELEHSIDPAYRPKAAWMCHDEGVQLIKANVDANGRPLFRAAELAPGQVDTVLGYQLWTNQDMPTPDTNLNKSLIFGDLSKFIIRIVRPMVMLRLDERYADNHQVGFLAFERCDADSVDASGGAFKYAETVT